MNNSHECDEELSHKSAKKHNKHLIHNVFSSIFVLSPILSSTLYLKRYPVVGYFKLWTTIVKYTLSTYPPTRGLRPLPCSRPSAYGYGLCADILPALHIAPNKLQQTLKYPSKRKGVGFLPTTSKSFP